MYPSTLAIQTAVRANLSEDNFAYLDGGAKDIFKALAVGIGRPFLYGLALDGQEKGKEGIRILRNELKRNMQLAGVWKLDEINATFVKSALLFF